jgi:hypothetical protein
MTGKLLAGVAGVAMVAASCVANAADLPPLGAEAVMEPEGPKVSVIAETGAIGIATLGVTGAILFSNTGVDVQFSSGLGVSLASQLIGIPSGSDYIEFSQGRVYYSTGALEFGVTALVSAELVPFSVGAYGVGPDFAYESERLSFVSQTLLTFEPGTGYSGWLNQTEATFNPNEKVEVVTSIAAQGSPMFGSTVLVDTEATISLAPHFQLVPHASVAFDSVGGTSFGAGVEGRFPLGAITPFVAVDWSSGSGTFLQVGADLEKQIKTSPFTLFGTAAFSPDLTGGGNHSVLAGIGIRYQMGEDPPDFFFDLFNDAL